MPQSLAVTSSSTCDIEGSFSMTFSHEGFCGKLIDG
jgi:hypothetical protein